MKKSLQKGVSLFLIVLALLFSAWLYTKDHNFIWYWLFGLSFGIILQRSRLCFVSATSEPFITGSTEQFRAILIGIFTASLGITIIKYLSGGTLDLLGVSAISFPLALGGFLFGIGMILCGSCSAGMFIRFAEGYIIHIFTFVCVIAGYLFANSHYQSIWSRFIINAPAIFLPHEIGWLGGVVSHIVVIVLLYLVAIKFEDGFSSSNSSTYLKGGIILGIFVVLHYVILNSSWSVTGAFFWLSDLSAFKNAELLPAAVGPNLRNIGLLAGALISVLFRGHFKIQKIRSGKQIFRNMIGGILMGYGACIASGCCVSSFFTAAASLSLSAWVFMIFLFIGAFVGLKLLYKML